jgi:hypothetical protein
MQQKHDHFKSNMAILVALVTILGAMAACRATVASSNASDADFEGVSAAIKAQKAEIVNEISAYEHNRAYTSYVRYLGLGGLLYDEGAKSNPASFESQWKELWGLADTMKIYFFRPRYVNLENGLYDIQRELDEERADDAQFNDLNPQPHFDRSDSLRWRSAILTADLIVFAIAFWLLTLAQIIENRLKYFLAALGVLTALAGTLTALLAGVWS